MRPRPLEFRLHELTPSFRFVRSLPITTLPPRCTRPFHERSERTWSRTSRVPSRVVAADTDRLALHSIRKEVVSEQSNALVETHSLVQDMSKTILALGTQVYDLQKMVAKLSSQVASSTSSSAPPPNLPSAPTAAPPPSSSSHLNGPPFHHHHQSPHVASHPINVLPSTSAYPVHLRNPSSSAPQPQFTPLFPQQAQPQAQALPPLQDPADLDDLWTEALMDPNPSALPQLVSMISPQALDLMLPISDAHGTSPLSQTVVLTLVHKVSCEAGGRCREERRRGTRPGRRLFSFPLAVHRPALQDFPSVDPLSHRTCLHSARREDS